jgi:peptidoglycan hydrolase-like protein with peptidoglycan-binding domain
MMKFKHVAFAGITALSFSQFAIAGGGSAHQQSAAPGVEQSTIRQAQEKLSGKGHDVSADGVLGPKTQTAVKEFQQKEGIQASGQLDQETLAALGVSEGSAGTGSTDAPSLQSAPDPTSEPQS